MRHIGSILLAMLIAPLALLLAGRGMVGLAEAAQAARTDYFGLTASACALGLAGLLYALLTMARLAPLGPTLAGLGYLAMGIWALLDRAGFLATVRGELVGLTDAQVLAAAGIAPLLAVPLVVTFGIPRRWRKRRELPGPAPALAPAPPAGPPTHTLDDLPRVPGPPPPPPAYAPPPPPPPAYAPPPPTYAPPPPTYAPPAPAYAPPPPTYAPQPPPPPPPPPAYPLVGVPSSGPAAGSGRVHGVSSDEVTANLPAEQTTTPLDLRPPTPRVDPDPTGRAGLR